MAIDRSPSPDYFAFTTLQETRKPMLSALKVGAPGSQATTVQ